MIVHQKNTVELNSLSAVCQRRFFANKTIFSRISRTANSRFIFQGGHVILTRTSHKIYWDMLSYFYLVFYLTSIQTFYLTYILAFYLAYFMAFYPAYNLAFYLNYLSGILPDIVSGILPDIYSDVLSGILSEIHSGMLCIPDLYSGILLDI